MAKEHNGKGHGWKGHGPERVCGSCGKKAGHISELYPNGPAKWKLNKVIAMRKLRMDLEYHKSLDDKNGMKVVEQEIAKLEAAAAKLEVTT